MTAATLNTAPDNEGNCQQIQLEKACSKISTLNSLMGTSNCSLYNHWFLHTGVMQCQKHLPVSKFSAVLEQMKSKYVAYQLNMKEL